ncbi:DEBR0S7_01332g1_1 [Brettanomyces bruxellensis]|uniref:DEBR0S7_01332g1_1 n=1 Tax=Dekkera bruxellensis TaxID=5007 RepID=A0A7D9H2N2_DEKBR|nr:DEBR0S7_01332g1_1 [Brettanomyces bruxellensis]
MKPAVTAGKAWFCTVLSAFGVLILSVIGALFYTNNEALVGSIDDPEDGKAVAKTIFGAVFIYLAFFVFCGSQLWIIKRQSKIHL